MEDTISLQNVIDQAWEAPTIIRAGIKKRIHVNQHNIKHNTKSEDRRPVLSVKTSTHTHRGNHIKIRGDNELVYSPDKPLSCGARVWIETLAEVEVA